MSKALVVDIYRRGRGIQKGKVFGYVSPSEIALRQAVGDKRFTSPGWYRVERKNVYRITVDHDYPDKPVWLGYRNRQGEWVNAESLYEPILVKIGNKVLYEARPRGWTARRIQTARHIVSSVGVSVG